MNVYIRLLVLLFLAIILSGCVRKEILDDINLIEGIGFDHSNQDGLITSTVLFPIYQPNQAPKNRTITAHGKMKKTALQHVQLQATNPVVTGSMELVLFGKELATQDGVLDLVDPFQRDPGVGSSLYVAIVDGNAQKLLEGEYGIKGNASFIHDLLMNNVKNEDLPRTNLQLFLSGYYTKGKTPFMPIIKQLDKDSVKLNGIAFLHNGKMVASIPPKKMFFFKLLVDKYSRGLHRVKIEGDEAAIRSIRSHHKFHLTETSPEEITIDIHVNGIINEFTGNRLTTNKTKKLKKLFEEEIEKECKSLILFLQEKHIDPIGLGQFVSTKKRSFDIDEWNASQYEDLKVNIRAHVKITEAGVIE